MRHIFSIILGVLLATSCVVDQDRFVYKDYMTSNEVRYSYKYENDKLMLKTEEILVYMGGVLLDTVVTNTVFVYDSNGLLNEEVGILASAEKPSRKIYSYDSKDSIVAQLHINNFGDTTIIEKFNYFNGEKKLIFYRFLEMRLDPNMNFSDAFDAKTYDTTQHRYEYDYSNGICLAQRQFDKNNNLMSFIRYEYANGRIIKEYHKVFTPKVGNFDMIKYYDYSKSPTKPDYYTIDQANDTADYCINLYKQDILQKSISMYDYGALVAKEYYMNGILIGTIDIHNESYKSKNVRSYGYDEKGQLVLERYYSESL